MRTHDVNVLLECAQLSALSSQLRRLLDYLANACLQPT